MQLMSKVYEKRLSLILGHQTIESLKKISILIVGAGGIGCQILKNLSKILLKKITIVDLDIIEISNLNRQFYFKTQHLGKSKAFIARQEILKINPFIQIEAIQGNIYDNKFGNFRFYSQFDLIISALDNFKARQYLAKNATKYGKVLIDAGSSGFHGQSYSSIRFLTSCHNCYPSLTEQNFAICTIRNRPQKSIHCAVYARNIYENIFCQHSQFMEDRIKKIKQNIQIKEVVLDYEKIKIYVIQLFDYLFYEQFKTKSNQIQQINLLKYEQAIQIDQNIKMYRLLKNSAEKSQRSEISIQKDKSKHLNYDLIWSVKQYVLAFTKAFTNLVARRHQKCFSDSNTSLSFEKDDDDCMIFVYCITSLRIFNFKSLSQASFHGNQPLKQRKLLKYLTFYECKNLLGKIIPAIASTNSIAASLETNQILEFVLKKMQNPKYYTFSPLINQKVSFSFLSLPNIQCKVCSPKNFYFEVQCNLQERKFQQFQQFAFYNCYSKGRDVYCQNLIIIKNINSNKISPNKKKPLNFKPNLINNDTLTLSFMPVSKISDLKIEITLIHQKNEKEQNLKFKIINLKQIQKTLSNGKVQQVLKSNNKAKNELNQDD